MEKIKMAKLKIFNNTKTQIDLSTFIDSRGLFCANSGAGKSWALRKFLEESHNKVMSIVLDVEGEFKTLREKYDFLLIGDNGDVEININSAKLLPKKLLELGVSTIIDISDLKRKERVMYVKKFLEALMELPRKYWKPCLIILDEAHVFAGQQEKQESTYAVIDLMTRGRKRGFCGVLCTQRIAKLHKDAVAEANNVMIGRTGLDIDMKRAADILGFNSKKDMLSLRDLSPGEFYAFGPAISKKIIQEKISGVKTTHPKVGMDLKSRISKPTPKIKSMLTKLSDLPKEYKEELIEKKDFIKKIRGLESQLRARKLPLKDKINPEQLRDLQIIKKENLILHRNLKKINQEYEIAIERIRKHEVIKKAMIDWQKQFNKILNQKSLRYTLPKVKVLPITKLTIVPKIKEVLKPIMPFKTTQNKEGDVLINIGKCPKKIYNFLYSNQERGFTKVQIGVMIGYSPKSGSFNNALCHLNAKGLIRREGELIYLERIDDELIEESEEFSIDLIKKKLGKCPLEIFNVLLENPDGVFSKEELAENTSSQYSSNSGSYNNAICKLSSLGFLERKNGLIKLSKYIEELL